MQRVRGTTATKIQQLEAAVQEKLVQAQTRRAQIEQEQKEKLRNHVSLHFLFPVACMAWHAFLFYLFFFK